MPSYGGVAAKIMSGQRCGRRPVRAPAFLFPYGAISHLVVAALAVVAAAARLARLEGNAVSCLDVLDILSDCFARPVSSFVPPLVGRALRTLDDNGGRLVAEDHGLLDDKVADAAMLQVVDVAAADARGLRSDDGAAR